MNSKHKIILITAVISLLVVCLTAIYQGWFTFFVLFSLGVVTVVWMIFKYIQDEKSIRFILYLFIISLFFRGLCIFTAYFYSQFHLNKGFFYKYVYVRGNDEFKYHNTGCLIADKLRNSPETVIKNPGYFFLIVKSTHFGYNILIGLIYYLCGNNIFYMHLINLLLSCWNIVLIFILARTFTHVTIARLSSLLVALDSYTLLYSMMAYKDIFLSFLASLFCWSFLQYTRENSKKYLLLAVLCGVYTCTVRIYLGAAMFFGVFVYFLIFKAPRERYRRMAYITLIVLLSLPILYLAGTFAYKKLKGGQYFVREQGQSTAQKGASEETEGGGEGNDSAMMGSIFSPKRLIMNTIRITFSPMPWRDLKGVKEDIYYVGYPGRLLWYAFIPFFFAGIYYCLRENPKIFTVPLATVLPYLFLCIVLMISGERHHVPVMPLVWLICAVGFLRVKNILFPYLIFLPTLIAFYWYDIKKPPMEIAIPIVSFYIIYFIFVFFLVRKELTLKSFCKVLSGYSGSN